MILPGSRSTRKRSELEMPFCEVTIVARRSISQSNALLSREVSKTLFCDNGTEFTSQAMDLWANHARVRIDFSRPGKPTDNAYVESFNGTLRSECLDAHWFPSLADAKQIIEAWRREYNESRPHRAHGERTPHEIACEFAASREFTSTQTAGDSLSE
jgi:putative transposase